MADHTCPVWAGYLMASPIRKLRQNPVRILGDHVNNGMHVLDVGCAMGFFSLPMAEMVGQTGRVICVDIQQKMLDVLKKRAKKKHLQERMTFRLCNDRSLGLDGLTDTIDFALMFAVVHELDEPETAMRDVFHSMRVGGKLLLAEPTGHVTEDGFQQTEQLAEAAGFVMVARPVIRRSHAVLMEKPAP